MNAKHLMAVGLSIVALGACSKQSSDNKSQAVASASAAAPLSDEAIDQAPIPVKEDYEEQAQKAITSDNLDEQLSQLEKQITDDK
jgi:hypothetical protein